MSDLEKKARIFSNTEGNQSSKSMREVEYDTGRYVGFLAGFKDCEKEYEEKLRWIPIEEKLPEITGWDYAPYIVKTKKEYLIAGYTDGWFHHIGGLCLKKGAVTHYRSFL